MDHARDILEIAEKLELKTFGVLAISAGGPYGLACAHTLPEERLKGVSIVAGMGPADIGAEDMGWSSWVAFNGFKYCPIVLLALNGIINFLLKQVSNKKMLEMTKRWAPKRPASDEGGKPARTDKRYLQQPLFQNLLINSSRELFKQGVDGYMDDGRVMVSDLGFRVEDIGTGVPVDLWYSTANTNVPLRIGEEIGRRLRQEPEMHVKEGETHLGLVLNHRFEILKRLLERMRA